MIAWQMTEVLSLMLYSYAFMVSGLLVPVVVGLFFGQTNATAATLSMIVGGCTTAGLIVSGMALPLELDANLFGLTASLLTFLVVIFIQNKHRKHLQVA